MLNDTTATPTEPGPGPSVLDVFEDFIRTREFENPPPPEAFTSRLDDDDSKQSFQELIESYAWTQDLMPRNVLPNVVLAGRFRLVEKLGAGGMGQVWRAEDQKLGKEVAVKVMSLIGTANIDSEAAFERETYLLAQLKHHGIVSVLDSDRDDEHRFIVMELIDGTSLDQVIANLTQKKAEGAANLGAADICAAIDTELEPGSTAMLSKEGWFEAVAKIMVEVLRTLEAAHARRVVHRDLKPGNIMLTAGGRPVLLDFGLGGVIGGAQGELTSSLFGTFRFVAPEQLARGKAGADVRTDVYQLGIVLYEFSTLIKCFDTEDHAELFESISTGRFKLPRAIDRDVPRDLEDVCLRAMDVNPTRRYQTVTEFREALERFLRHEPVHPDQYGAASRMWRNTRYFARRNRNVLIGFAAIVMAIVLTLWVKEAWTNPVEIHAMAVTPSGNAFRVEVDRDQFLIGICKIRNRATRETLYRPAQIAAGDEDQGSEFVLLPSGRSDLVARLPADVREKASFEEISCMLFPDAELGSKVRHVVQNMRKRMLSTGALGVDQAWIDAHWNPLMRSGTDVGIDVPKDVLFGAAQWSAGGANAVTLKWQ